MPGDETQRINPAEDALLALAPGRRVFGRYTLEAIAGRGGMGVVWRAHDDELDRTVALKFLPEAIAADPEAVRDLKRETRRCLELTHPSIVRVYDLVQEGGSAAIAMEFVDGETLAKRKVDAPGGCLAAAELAPLMAQLCAALDYAHREARIVHRDLKPANLLITREGKLKITDFGIARSLTETHTRLTGVATGSTSGTLPYMSPQQLAGDKPTESDDLYALGATIYELLAGKPPFFRGDMASMILQIRERTPAALAAHRADAGCEGAAIPAAWAEIALACLDKKPARRPRTAGEVAARLGLVESMGYTGTGNRATTMEEPAAPAAVPPVPGETGAVAPPEAGVRAPDVSGRRPAVAEKAGRKSKMAPWLAVAAVVVVGAVLGGYFGLYAPAQKRAAVERTRTASEQARETEARRAADEKRVTGEKKAAEENRVVDEQRAAAESARLEAFAIVAAKVDALVDGSTPALRDATELAVRNYLAATSGRHRDDIERRWTQRAAGWETARLAAARGGLIVTTTPPGAEVAVGGLALEKSPAALKEVKLGKYPVIIRLAGYEEQRREVEVKENEFAALDVTMVRAVGAAQLASAPAGLAFVLTGSDQTETGTTPARLEKLPTGNYTFVVVREGWPDQTKKVTVARGQTVEVLAEFVGGGLEIASTPAGAEVWAQGRNLGKTPLKLGDLVPAGFDLELRLKGYTVAPARGEIRSRETTRVSLALEIIRPEPAQPWVVPDLSLGMVWLRPGTFAMGTPPDQAVPPGSTAANKPGDNQAAAAAVLLIGALAQGIQALQRAEIPQTNVTLTRGWWLGKAEVTQAQYEAVMGANPSQFKNAGNSAPVENVSWEEAMQFCRRLTEQERAAGRLPEGCIYTLPTEAQWEYACRASSSGLYSGNLDTMGWYAQNSGNQPHPVGQKQANAWLLCDMHGNVSEWCLDTFGNYPGGTVTDYSGPAPGAMRVYRGGSWKSGAQDCRSAARGREKPGWRSNSVGFRLALVQTR
ncbi:MAG: SUMF1/EgtB/PvdO family nonheme iron enzyme [Verrucomicrobia bacterium]|nr:SUMF1/EgtB/PvdO family nonheme iron enzyme [Verrucomicrobiota bacterium]